MLKGNKQYKTFRHNGVALVYTTKCGKLDVWREENGTYSIILKSKRATVAQGLLSKKNACEVAEIHAYQF